MALAVKVALAVAKDGEYSPLLSGCRSVDHYERLNKIDEGT
jgi:hypothetical protein